MAMNLSNDVSEPSFLKRAHRVEEKTPSFLKRSKLISSNQEEFPSDEEVQKDIERNQAQFTSRIAESVLGLPGDLVNFAGGLFGYEPEIPGSQKLREVSENITGGYTKPKNELEEKAGELMQDIALFALPGAKHYSIARNIGIPVAANLLKEGIKYSGGDEKQQNYGKVGSMVIMDILNHRKALGTSKQYISDLFKKADEAIPKGLSIKSSNLENSLNKLEKSLSSGGKRPSTGDALEKIAEIKDKIKNGKIDLKELVAYRPAINEWIDKYKGFEIGSSPAMRKKIIHNLNQVKSEVINAAEEYGSKYNPEYLKLSQSANEAYAAHAASNKITNFIQKHAGNKVQSTGAKALLGLGGLGAGALGSIASIGSTAAVGAIGSGGYKLFKTILRSKSPTIRNHYFNILKGASAGNAAVVSKNVKLLDKELMNLDKTGEIEEYTED